MLSLPNRMSVARILTDLSGGWYLANIDCIIEVESNSLDIDDCTIVNTLSDEESLAQAYLLVEEIQLYLAESLKTLNQVSKKEIE